MTALEADPECDANSGLDIERGTPESIACLILAHGAGADKDSEFMQDMATRIAKLGITVVRFNFDYMIKRQQDGKRRPPDRMPKLQQNYKNIIEQVHQTLNLPMWIGGKSMGGRVASLISEEQENVRGFIGLGFPFHAPGKPPKDRILHLEHIDKPSLIIQGDRDTMGTRDEVNTYSISKLVEIAWLEDGDHSLKPRKKSGHSYEQHLESTALNVANFIRAQLGKDS
jgi:uncharacterized protein